MTYRPRKAPGRKFKHADDSTRAYLVNSKQGSVAAKKAGYGWVDNDFHLSAPSNDNVCSFVNGHGNPETTWGYRKFETRTWATLSKLRRGKFRLRTGGQALRQNAKLGLNTEFELKDVHPRQDYLAASFKRLAVEARKAYGPNWRNRVNVKVLTDLSGGVDYALHVCRAAHAAGFKTIVLARGKARYKSFAGHEEVTWVRGSAVKFR